jgi:hypothetical protein
MCSCTVHAWGRAWVRFETVRPEGAVPSAIAWMIFGERNASGTRRRTWRSARPSAEAISSNDAVLSAISFLRRRLHLDLSDYTEYLGGLTLVVPDPVLRRVQHFQVPAQDADGLERLVYRLVARPGQSFDELKLTVLERRSNLLSRFETVNVPADGLVTVESALPFDQTGYAISHTVQGVIAYQQPIPFIRAVRVSLGVAGRRVRVQVPRTSLRSPTDTYEITEYAHEIPVGVGQERDDAIVKVVEAEQRRIRRAAAKRYKQTWFDGGQRDKAISFLRGQFPNPPGL